MFHVAVAFHSHDLVVMTQPTVIYFYPNKCSQDLCHYPFAVHLDNFRGSYNTLVDLTRRACVPNETQDLNLNFLNMITGINKSRILT